MEKVHRAAEEAGRRRLGDALGIGGTGRLDHEHLRLVANALELRVTLLLDDENPSDLCAAAAEAFRVARVLPHDGTPTETAQSLVRLGCLGVLGDRGADVKRLLVANGWPVLPVDADDWGQRVWSTILDVWLRLFRKQGWDDLDAVQAQVVDLRASQRKYEPRFLHEAEQRQDAGPAWELVTTYHLAKAAEILGQYLSQGAVDGRYDIREQLEAQFDRAVAAAAAGRLMERETFVRLLARTARPLVGNSIRTVTRAVNSRVSTFVESMTSRDRRQPIFEMLPPQRRALREQGLLGSGHRSVVVSLPTSSGKTFIAQLRILQALNQFDRERGWVAYLAPTRALVNQLTLRLRRDFADLGITVEKVSPALEIDGLEADMLVDVDAERQFRLLVTTPEKLDLMLRDDWERRIGRPLTLVVVDEAHGLASGPRGLRLELLLATINRECRYAQFLLLTPFICDWVQGHPLSDMAADYFAGKPGHGDDATGRTDSVTAMTRCCRSIFGRLTKTASWGLAALQSLTIGDSFDSLPGDEQRMLRNLPARVYYGVNSDEAIALRLLGVPRTAAAPLARQLEVGAAEPLHEVRARVRSADVDTWKAALGSQGASHHRVWSIIEGEI